MSEEGRRQTEPEADFTSDELSQETATDLSEREVQPDVFMPLPMQLTPDDVA
jgi:hypothetical protein